MKLHQLVALAGLWILLWAGSAQATTYYISPAGNDHHAGTSPLKPWATLAKVNATTFQAGDSLLLQGGSTFTGGIFLGKEVHSSAEKPFVISSYGKGWATISSGNATGLLVYNAAGISISRLHFKGAGRLLNTSSGIDFYMDLQDTRLPYIHIDSVTVEGYQLTGILVGSWSGSSGYDGVTITHSQVHDVGEGGISSYAEAILGHTNFYVAHNKIFNISGRAERKDHHTGSGIVLGGIDGALIEYCEAYNNGWLNAWTGGGPVGIWGYRCNNLIIQYNESHHNKTGTSKDGGGFDIDGGCTNCTMQYNYSHDNEGAGYLIAQYPEAPPMQNVVIRYNISENDARKGGYGAIHLWSSGASGGIQDAHIYNNTVYLTPSGKGTPRAIHVQNAGVKRGRFNNNILQTTGGLELVYLDKNADVRFEGNTYWTTGTPFKVRWAGVLYTSLQNWQKALQQEMLNGLATGLFTDPQLKAPGQGITSIEAGMLYTLTGYQLMPGSPLPGQALDLLAAFGTNLGDQDFWGNQVKARSDRAPGAHQPTQNGTSCLHGGPISLDFGATNDGLYAGAGIKNGETFDPALAGQGTHALQYTYTDEEGKAITSPYTMRVVDAGTTEWKGQSTGNDDWFDSKNWSSCVPTAQIDARIPLAENSDAIISPGHLPRIKTGRQAQVKDLWASDTLPIKGEGSLEINGVFLGEGVDSDPEATIIFKSKDGKNIPAGNYGNLILKGNHDVLLKGDITVSQELILGEGKLFLGDHDLSLGTEAQVSNVTPQHYIVLDGAGRISIEAVGNGRSAIFPVGTSKGYSPALLQNSGITDVFSLGLEDQVWSNGTQGTLVDQQCVNKTWHIDEGEPGGSQVTLQLQWHQADELQYFDPADSYISHFEKGKWSAPGDDAAYAIPNNTDGTYTIQLKNITSFSPFAISNRNYQLPVTLSSFEVRAEAGEGVLHWTTAEEKDNAGFTVEVAEDGQHFRSLGFVPSKSTNSSTFVSYSFRDREAGKTGIRYYRLMQKDLDGTITYSPLRSAHFGLRKAEFKVYPNPFQDRLTLEIAGKGSRFVEVLLRDVNGRQLLHRTEQLVDGRNTFTLSLSDSYPAGIYLLSIRQGDVIQQLKLIKK